MVRFDRTAGTLEENLALDEALLLDAERGGPEAIRFWEWESRAVVMGAGGRRAEEADLARCAADGVPVLRRASGGGTVLLGPGCVNYALVLSMVRDPRLADVRASYRAILERIAGAFADLPGIGWNGVSDLTLGDRKVSGSAQQRKRTHLLHHGTLLCGFDLSAIDVYLLEPPRMPEYRHGRPHSAFVANLPLAPAEARERLTAAFPAEPGLNEPSDLVDALVLEKYGDPAWHARR